MFWGYSHLALFRLSLLHLTLLVYFSLNTSSNSYTPSTYTNGRHGCTKPQLPMYLYYYYPQETHTTHNKVQCHATANRKLVKFVEYVY